MQRLDFIEMNLGGARLGVIGFHFIIFYKKWGSVLLVWYTMGDTNVHKVRVTP